MKISTNQLKFAGILCLLTISFRFSLSALLNSREFAWGWAIAALFGVLAFASGWFFGKKDYESLPLSDIGFRYNLATWVVFNAVSELWFILGFASRYESIKAVHRTVPANPLRVCFRCASSTSLYIS
jgi:hypothetical protein